MSGKWKIFVLLRSVIEERDDSWVNAVKLFFFFLERVAYSGDSLNDINKCHPFVFLTNGVNPFQLRPKCECYCSG